MPDQLVVMTPYISFNFIALPADYQNLVYQYYKEFCKNCKTQPKDSAICLLCGEIVCWLQNCCKDLPGMRKNEGELTFHARTKEGGQCVYLLCSTGQIFYIDKDRSCDKPSPYMNKFGETCKKNTKRWDNFYFNEEYGGKQALDDIKRIYMNF